MSATPSSASPRAPLKVVLIALLAAVGVALGWFLPPVYLHTIDQIRKVLEPVAWLALCFGLIHLQLKQRRVSIAASLLCCCSLVLAILAVLRN